MATREWRMPAPGNELMPTNAGGAAVNRKGAHKLVEVGQMLGTGGFPPPARSKCMGRRPVDVRSMFTESIPTLDGPALANTAAA
jgi:hypothetical protein